MALYRAQIGFPMDTDFPRDVITINPHFAGDNPQALANQLKTNLGLVTTIGTTRPFRIKIYDAMKAPPSYPLAEVVQGTGNNSSAHPALVAVATSCRRATVVSTPDLVAITDRVPIGSGSPSSSG